MAEWSEPSPDDAKSLSMVARSVTLSHCQGVAEFLRVWYIYRVLTELDVEWSASDLKGQSLFHT
jgi:hypothetical protein